MTTPNGPATDDYEEQPEPPRKARATGLANWGNRLVVALVVGWLAWAATGKKEPAVLVFATVACYVLVTAIVGRRRD